MRTKIELMCLVCPEEKKAVDRLIGESEWFNETVVKQSAASVNAVFAESPPKEEPMREQAGTYAFHMLHMHASRNEHLYSLHTVAKPVDWLQHTDADGVALDEDALEREHRKCMAAVTYQYDNVDSTE